MSIKPSRFILEKVALTLVFSAVFGVTFVSLDRWNATVPHGSTLPLELPIDEHIPYVPAFVFAYVLYYPWLLVPAIVLRERSAFYRAFRAFLLMQIIACATFVLLPSRMVRPEIDATGVVGGLLTWLHGVDKGWNVLPSLHTGHSVLAAIFARTYRPKAFPIVVTGTILIVLSTVLIKQHYVIDLPAGMLLAWLSYRLAGMRAATFSALATRITGMRMPASHDS